MAENSSSHERRGISLRVPAGVDVDFTDGNSILACLASTGIIQSVLDNDGNQRWKLDEQVYEETVRTENVRDLVETDSDTTNHEWWKQVQSLECTNPENSNYHWKLHAGYFEKEIRAGKNMYELLEILSDCGHLIKNYRVENKFTCEIYENIYFTLIPPKCKNIVNLKVDSTPIHYALGTWNMSENWKDLEKISFKYLTKSAKCDFYKLLEKNKNLKFLDLDFEEKCIKTDKFFNYIPDTIEELHLGISKVDTIKFKYYRSAIARFTSLRTLFCFCQKFGNELAMVLGTLTSLTCLGLYISENCESDCTFDHIASLTNLKQLFLTDNDCLQDNNLITIINGCQRLSLLEISGCKNITDKGAAHLAKLTELNLLHMRGINGISSETIRNLPSTLQILNCDGFDKDDSCMQELMQKATNLKLASVTGSPGNASRLRVNIVSVITHLKSTGVLLTVLEGTDVDHRCFFDSQIVGEAMRTNIAKDLILGQEIRMIYDLSNSSNHHDYQ